MLAMFNGIDQYSIEQMCKLPTEIGIDSSPAT